MHWSLCCKWTAILHYRALRCARLDAQLAQVAMREWRTFLPTDYMVKSGHKHPWHMVQLASYPKSVESLSRNATNLKWCLIKKIERIYHSTSFNQADSIYHMISISFVNGIGCENSRTWDFGPVWLYNLVDWLRYDSWWSPFRFSFALNIHHAVAYIYIWLMFFFFYLI